jgi:predicted esterase
MYRIVLLISCSLVAAACGSTDTNLHAAEQTMPTIEPGALAVGEVTIDGANIQYVSIVPVDFTVGDTAPVLLALPPGAPDLSTTTGVAQGTYQAQAVARGWVVVSPVAPNGELFFRGSERLLPGFLDFVESWVSPEGGGVHLAGISNGGISSFRIAAQQPDRFLSLTVFPGFPRSEADVAAVDKLVNIPVHLFVGENDTSWIEPMQDTFDRLSELDGDVTFRIFPNEGHIIGALSDGAVVFDEMDAAR